jgi:hypothetical protein
MKSFKRVPDIDICHVWQCPNCATVKNVGPTFYVDSGTPLCDECDGDGVDMLYLYTEVWSE